MKLLDHGELTLEASCADDLSVVNAARVSMNKQHLELELPADEKLIHRLMSNGHGTPFEHNYFRFGVKAPIMVFREWHRHRVGHSYNEWSARYSKLDPEFYVPSGDQIRVQVGKAMDYKYEPAAPHVATDYDQAVHEASVEMYDLYEAFLAAGLAKEIARVVLPVNTYSRMYWSCNARSLMHFLGLRTAEGAMWEIRQYALAAESIFASVMPITHTAFVANGRHAP